MTSGLDRLAEWVREWRESGRPPGISVALFDRSGTVRTIHDGVSDYGSQSPVTDTTLFQIGSISKSFTAFATVKAAELGLIELHEPVTRYLDWFEVPVHSQAITLHHLLTHTAGFMTVIDHYPDPRSMVWALRNFPTAWPPGERFHHSDLGYMTLTLGLILEKVCKSPLAEVLSDWIFEPLGMGNSFGAITHELRSSLATGYMPEYDDRPRLGSDRLIPVPWIEVGAGDSCVASTANDMALFGAMLLNNGALRDDRLLTETKH